MASFVSLCRAFGSLLFSPKSSAQLNVCLLAAHVQRIILTLTHFYSLLVKIILTTQLAGTRAISQCLGGVIDPVFRRLNNSLFPDEDLFRCCGWGRSIPSWTSLTAGLPAPPLLSFWLGRRCSSGQFLLSAVISGFPLSPLDNYFSRLLPLRREAAL